MASLLDYTFHSLIQCNNLVFKFILPHRLSLRCVVHFDHLHLDPRLLHQLCHYFSGDPPIGKLPMKEAASHFDSIWSLLLHGFSRSDENELLVCNVRASHSRLIIMLLQVLGHLLLGFTKVHLLSRHDSLIRLLQ